MKLIIYPKLSTRSKRAILKTKKQWGKKYQYRPRYNLIQRLQSELNWTREQVLEQIVQEREYLIKINE